MVGNQLSEHFSLDELTYTNRVQFQAQNRVLDDDQIECLADLATLLEKVRTLLAVPLLIHSGYRCGPLNAAVGSSIQSQHRLCQAADFVPPGLDLGAAFRTIWAEVAAGKLPVGELIFETANRAYGATSWLHISLGTPYRDALRCNQVLRMRDGVYEMMKGQVA